MAKPNPGFEKRAREQKKRLKQVEKAKRKAEREEAKRLGLPSPDGSGGDAAGETAEGSDSAAASAGTDSTAAADAPPAAGDEAPGGSQDRSD